jgi:hypothetical protein
MKPNYVESKTKHETTTHRGYCTNCHFKPITVLYTFCPKCGCRIKHSDKIMECRINRDFVKEGALEELPARVANILYQNGFDLAHEITQVEDKANNQIIFRQTSAPKLIAYSEQEAKQQAIDAFVDRVAQPKKYQLKWTKGINKETKSSDWGAESEASVYDEKEDVGDMGRSDSINSLRYLFSALTRIGRKDG